MPDGRSIRSPWFAIIITVPLRVTPFPKVTSPDTVKWSNSKRSGMAGNLVRNSLTYKKNHINYYYKKILNLKFS